MLDLDHPDTPHVFAASTQLDLILDFSKRITLSDAAGRRFMLEVVRPAFVALRWLNRERFGASSNIALGIDQLEREVETLVGLHLNDLHGRRYSASRCPACDGQMTSPHEYDPVPYCPKCLDLIMPGLCRVRSCEEGFGTDAI